MLVIGVGVLAWLAGVITFGDTLEPTSVEEGVTTVLTEHYGESDVSEANCPSGESANVGHTFSCTVKIGNEARDIEDKVLNEDREFEFGAPE